MWDIHIHARRVVYDRHHLNCLDRLPWSGPLVSGYVYYIAFEVWAYQSPHAFWHQGTKQMYEVLSFLNNTTVGVWYSKIDMHCFIKVSPFCWKCPCMIFPLAWNVVSSLIAFLKLNKRQIETQRSVITRQLHLVNNLAIFSVHIGQLCKSPGINGFYSKWQRKY